MTLNPLPRLRTPDPHDGDAQFLTSVEVGVGRYTVAGDAFAPTDELQISPVSLRKDNAGNQDYVGQIKRTVEWHHTAADGTCIARPCHVILQFIIPKDCAPPKHPNGTSQVDRITSLGYMIMDLDDLRIQGLFPKILMGTR